MNIFSSTHEPYWIASTDKADYPKLTSDIKVDVAIVGGGITGITTAFLLKNKGLKVAVLEAGIIARGTTGHTTAKITSQHGFKYNSLITKFGMEKAKQYADANEASIHFIDQLVKERNIDCDFCWRPAYVYTQSEDYVDKIEKEVDAALSLGINAEYQKDVPIPLEVKAAVRFDYQAQFHPLKYILSLAKEIPGDGSHIFEFTKVVDIEDGEGCAAITSLGFKVSAKKIVIASHYPCYDGMGMYFSRLWQSKSYVLAVKANEKLAEGMFVTAEVPGFSLRSQKYQDGELILVSGEGHKTGSESHTNVHYTNLGNFAKGIFTVEQVLYRWSTQDCISADGVPYTGYLTANTSNLLVATGFAKWGMTNSTASARIITDLITKGESPWAPVYDPSRVDIAASGPKMVTENLDVAKNFISGKLKPVPKDTDIKNGDAGVISEKGNKIGAYRDEQGVLHKVDITCTHLGCELVWNEAEKTWDCPCHGSRFSYDGENIEGPAFNPLKHQGEGKNKKDANII